MKVCIEKNYNQLSKLAADFIEDQVIKKSNSVLGLATGSTPVGLYQELVRRYQQKKLDFSQVVIFNLDEYIGLPANHPQSYRYFMKQHLFSKTNFKSNNVFIPSGQIKNFSQHCRWYEDKIRSFGGIDIQILGIGRNGHIGFNEPGSKFDSRTRVVSLDKTTIKDNSRFFDSFAAVPKRAITMGLATIFSAKNIILLASGENKKEILAKSLNGPASENLPASILQSHHSVTVIADKEAGLLLV